MSTVDVLIVGGGPAGLSAALTLVRQNHPLMLFDTNESRAMPLLKLHGVSLADGKPPAEYFVAAHTELSAYQHFRRITAEIVEIKQLDEGTFEAKDNEGKSYRGKKVILANGVKDHFPDIEGYDQAWGKGIFHNPFAQGRQQDATNSSSGVLAVDWIAMPKFAMHLTHLLSQLTPTVTIYTHGNTELASQLETLVSKALARPAAVKIDSRRISRLALKSHDQSQMEIHFDGGQKTTESFLGHAARTELNGPFAKQLGLGISKSGGEYLAHGPTNMTNIEGVYVAGDAMSMFKVWPNAVASGAVTAAGVAIKLQEELWNLNPIYG